MRQGLALDAGTPEDLAAILAIERASYTNPWSERGLAEALGDPSRFRVLVLRGPSAERGVDPREVHAYCIFQVVADELQIHNLVVAKEERRQGLARQLLLRTLELGREGGALQALLEVRAGNQAALELYRGLGFLTLGVRREYYLNPREDAILLGKGLS